MLRRGVVAGAVLGAVLASIAAAQAQSTQPSSRTGGLIEDLMRAAAPAVGQKDAVSGLKEALGLSVNAAVARLGAVDGFYRNPAVRIPLPRQLAQVQRTLQPLGLSRPLDDLELRVNRGAEAAMPRAKQLFLDAVRQITFADAVAILRGGDSAATQFLRSKSETQLSALIKPHLTTALQGAGAFTALDAATARSGLASAGVSGRSLQAELVDFAAARTLDAAFSAIAAEERAIRNDPVRRTSALLRRVFGS